VSFAHLKFSEIEDPLTRFSHGRITEADVAKSKIHWLTLVAAQSKILTQLSHGRIEAVVVAKSRMLKFDFIIAELELRLHHG